MRADQPTPTGLRCAADRGGRASSQSSPVHAPRLPGPREAQGGGAPAWSVSLHDPRPLAERRGRRRRRSVCVGEPDMRARASAPADTDSRVWTAPRRAPQGGCPVPQGPAAPPQELRRESSWVSSFRASFLIRALVNFGDGRVTCDRNHEPHGFPDLGAGCRRAPTRLWAFRGGRRHQATESGRVATRACGAVAASGRAGGRAGSRVEHGEGRPAHGSPSALRASPPLGLGP